MQFNKVFRARANAVAVAIALQDADEDNWIYRVDEVSTGWVVTVCDEYGNYLGAL